MPLLTVVVPCFNAEDYMRRAVDSLLVGIRPVEIIIVNDGSTDSTAHIADQYAEQFPSMIRVVHKENGGHGSAVNAGVELARGKYLKVVDADDWLDPSAYGKLLDLLTSWEASGLEADLVVSNFVYEKTDKHYKKALRYTAEMPVNCFFGWESVKPFRPWKYMLMHSLLYRTQVIRDSGLKLPEHSFYVDNLYAFVPLKEVRTLFYLDADLYRYWIGREGQSVNERIMIKRIDQQLRINKLLFKNLSLDLKEHDLPPHLTRYLAHYLQVITLVSSTLCKIDNDPELREKYTRMWGWMESYDKQLAQDLLRSPIGRITRLNVPITKLGYKIAQATIGFS